MMVSVPWQPRDRSGGQQCHFYNANKKSLAQKAPLDK